MPLADPTYRRLGPDEGSLFAHYRPGNRAQHIGHVIDGRGRVSGLRQVRDIRLDLLTRHVRHRPARRETALPDAEAKPHLPNLRRSRLADAQDGQTEVGLTLAQRSALIAELPPLARTMVVLAYCRSRSQNSPARSKPRPDRVADILRPDLANDLRWYFERRRGAANRRALTFADPEFWEADEAFKSPRFRQLYRRWVADGDRVFESLSSPALAQALERGSVNIRLAGCIRAGGTSDVGAWRAP